MKKDKKQLNDFIKEALKEGIAIDGKMTTTPRDTDIVSFSINYSDGSSKLVKNASIIYVDNANVDTKTHKGMAMEGNTGSMSFQIEALMCHAVSIESAGLNARKIVDDGINMILNKKEK